MPPTKTWKSRERQVAAFFGSKRTPLSGGNSGHTRSDSLHPRLFIEAKHRKSYAVINLYDATAELAAKEGKVPVVALSIKGRKGFYLLMKAEDLTSVAKEIVEDAAQIRSDEGQVQEDDGRQSGKDQGGEDL